MNTLGGEESRRRRKKGVANSPPCSFNAIPPGGREILRLEGSSLVRDEGKERGSFFGEDQAGVSSPVIFGREKRGMGGAGAIRERTPKGRQNNRSFLGPFHKEKREKKHRRVWGPVPHREKYSER